MSHDITYMVKCPICHGKGQVESKKCPYDADTEAECDNCHLSGTCGQVTYCDCDGGYVSENERKMLLKEMEG